MGEVRFIVTDDYGVDKVVCEHLFAKETEEDALLSWAFSQILSKEDVLDAYYSGKIDVLTEDEFYKRFYPKDELGKITNDLDESIIEVCGLDMMNPGDIEVFNGISNLIDGGWELSNDR